MNFKVFEEMSIVKEPQGLLKKSAQVKRWHKIGVGKSGDGYGVFAIDDMIDNELIEDCPAIEIPVEDIKNSVIIDYTFKINNSLHALGWGNSSIYNHRNQPNARWEYSATEKLIKFYTVRPIQKGEEITISYGKEYFNSRNKNMKS